MAAAVRVLVSDGVNPPNRYSILIGIYGMDLQKVGADNSVILEKIVDTLTSISNPKRKANLFTQKVGEVNDSCVEVGYGSKRKNIVLILDAGRVCQPAVELLPSIGRNTPLEWTKSCSIAEFQEQNCVQVVVASLFLKDAEEFVVPISHRRVRIITVCKLTVPVYETIMVFDCSMHITEGIPEATTIQLDVMDRDSLYKYIAQ
nr:alpha-aminoadipic semialdehyde synthase [Tanacetum cinerariifolium]